MSLHCSTDASPEDIEYQLYFNGLLIGNNGVGVFNVTVKADGVYTCVPINTVGAGDNATASVTVLGELVLFLYVLFFCALTLLKIPEIFSRWSYRVT